ncbi:hypothetical protein CLOM_g15982 [Closterium sp. NIES-68]|nr:hypothetical protein CLOM_g15982 [Closterium sp. NIES-68]
MYRPSFLDPTAPSSSSPAVAAATAAAAAAATAAVVAVAAAAAAVKASPHEQWAGRIKESLAEHQWHRTAGNGSQRSQHSKHSMSSHRPGSSSGATAFGTALNSGDGGGGGVGGRRPHSAGALSSVTHLLAKPAVSPASVIFTPAFKPPPLGLEGLCEAVHEEQQHLSLAALQQQKLLQRQLQQQYAERQQRAGGRGGDARRGGVQRLLILESDDEMDEDDEFSLDVRTPTLVRGGLGGRGGGGGGGDGGDGAPAGTRELGKKGSGSGYGRSAANEPSPRSTIAPYFKSISIPSIGSPESSDIEYSEGGRQFKGGDFGDRSSDQGSVNSASNSDEDGDNEEDNIEDEDDDDDNDNVDENGDGVSTTVTFSGGHWRMAAATTRLVRSTSLRSCPGDRAKRSESWGIHWKLGLGIRVSSNDDLKGAGAGAGAGTGAPAAVGSKPAMLKWLREGPKPDAAAASEQEEGGGLGLLLGRAHSTGKEAAAELVAAAIRVLRKAGSEGSGGGRGTAGRPPPSPTTPSGSKEGWDAGSAAGSGAGSATTSPASAAGDGSRASGNGSDGGKRSFSGTVGD